MSLCLLFIWISVLFGHVSYSKKIMDKLVASDGAEYDDFGWSVSIYKDTAIVGSFNDDDNGTASGSAYVYSMVNGTWIQIQKLTAYDPAANDHFGISVCIYGNDVLIASSNGDADGSVYVFGKTDEEKLYTFSQKLTTNDNSSGYLYGEISMYNTTAIIGYSHDGLSYTGSAYVFVKENGTWTQQTKLTDENGTTYDQFGFTVSIYGDWCIVGASGMAVTFQRTDGIWSQNQTLYANESINTDNFAISVVIYGDYALVGRHTSDSGGNSLGSAYVFELSGGVWSLTNRLTASDGTANNNFGYGISVYDKYAVIGADGEDGEDFNTGSIYIFERIGYGNWTQIQKIIANNASQDDQFGQEIRYTSDDQFIVAAKSDDDKAWGAGAAYIMTNYQSCDDVWNKTYDQGTLIGTNNEYLVNWMYTECLFTDYPTTDPTIEPTEPSLDPTIEPTNKPNWEPTPDPTIDPTNEPTEPSNDPTFDPSTYPTTEPSWDPTIDPSTNPTNDPTADPSIDPTNDPTTEPTMRPSIAPTVDFVDGASAHMYMSAIVFAFTAVVCL